MHYIHSESNKKGFVLYIVCALAFGLFILVAGLSKFKTGAVLQLSTTVTQEKMIVVAQAAINEMLANVKGGINDASTSIGGSVKSFWKSGKAAPANVASIKMALSSLPATKQMAEEHLGSDGKVEGEIYINVTDSINQCGVNSYIGFVKLVSSVSCDGVKNAVKITEQHDIKITDLSFPFLDKYALFVKSFCQNINSTEKNFVVQGVSGGANNYSFIYLGNRNYPKCKDYPEGSKSSKHPPVILDLNFEKDKGLLGAAFNANAGMALKDSANQNLAKGKFFMTSQKGFDAYKDNFSPTTDFHNTTELRSLYFGLVQASRNALTGQFSTAYLVVNDFNNAGGKPENSEVFQGILYDVFPVWKYYYGYTDYLHVFPTDKSSFGATHPFSGLLSYFNKKKEDCPVKCMGGEMPAFFGEDRKTPVYIEGPCYVRFFKVGLFDEVTVNFDIGGGRNFDVAFPCVSCVWEDPQATFSGKDVGRIDGMTSKLMSHPVEFLSINNFFFGSGENVENKDDTIAGGTHGYNIFHYIDSELKTVSHFYLTAEDFMKDRIKNCDGQELLDLDGISVVFGQGGGNLDLSNIKKYRGKGMIATYGGNCLLGNLEPVDKDNCYLKIILNSGRFFVDENQSDVTIWASLVSLVKNSDNSSVATNQEGGFFTKGVTTHLIGNLIIDDLFDIRDKTNFKITHDPRVYSNEYPVRVSVGAPKSLYQLDYNGKD